MEAPEVGEGGGPTLIALLTAKMADAGVLLRKVGTFDVNVLQCRTLWVGG